MSAGLYTLRLCDRCRNRPYSFSAHHSSAFVSADNAYVNPGAIISVASIRFWRRNSLSTAVISNGFVVFSISFSSDRQISCAAHNSPSKKPHRNPITIRWAVNCVTFIPFIGSASFISFISLSFNFFFSFVLTNVFACIEEIARYLLTSSTEPKKDNCCTLIEKLNKKARNWKMAFSAGEAQSKYANDGSLSAKFKTPT